MRWLDLGSNCQHCEITSKPKRSVNLLTVLADLAGASS